MRGSPREAPHSLRALVQSPRQARTFMLLLISLLSSPVGLFTRKVKVGESNGANPMRQLLLSAAFYFAMNQWQRRFPASSPHFCHCPRLEPHCLLLTVKNLIYGHESGATPAFLEHRNTSWHRGNKLRHEKVGMFVISEWFSFRPPWRRKLKLCRKLSFLFRIRFVFEKLLPTL